MNAPLGAAFGTLALTDLAAPGRLTRATRLYGVVLDGAGDDVTRAAAGEEDALDRVVAGLGAAAGEQDLVRRRAEEGGDRIACDAVVLTSDLAQSYSSMLGLKPWRVRRLSYSPSAYVLLAGSRAGYESIGHHNIHFGGAWESTFDELEQGRLMRDRG